MAFFYDICDYLNNNVIGSGTTEVDCTEWGDMFLFADATRGAFINSFKGYVYGSSPCISGETCSSVFDTKIYTDFFRGTYIDYYKKFLVFWNMMMCSPVTGVQSESLTLPKIDGTSEVVSFDVDYGDGSFSPTIVREYQALSVTLECEIKNIMVLVMNETFQQSTLTDFYPIV
jgi:hypothetical protein